MTQKEQSTEIDAELKNYILTQIAERQEAKKNKNYALADQIRNELAEKGITLKDTPNGTEYEMKKYLTIANAISEE